MSKLIVDQIQKNGGDALTLPATDATTANQPLVGSTTGVLSFGATGLPAADGTSGNVLTANGAGGSTWSALSVPAVPDDNILAVGMVISTSARENLYSTGEWSSTGPNSTYYNRLSDASSIISAWNMALSDGKPDSTTAPSNNMSTMFYSNDHGSGFHREKMFAHNRRLGHNYRNMYYNDNAGTSQNYGGISISLLPIRNHGASSATISLPCSRSGGSNYGGTGVVYYSATYSSGTNYANATGGTWTTCQASQTNSDYVNYTASITIPAGATIIVMMTSTHRYYTTYRFKDTHMYYDLHSTFTGNIKCDLRMLEALYMGRSPADTSNTVYPYEIYTTCASLMGDR